MTSARPSILWAPREILCGRSFRVPVHSTSAVEFEAGPFRIVQQSEPRDNVVRFFLKAPESGVAGKVTVRNAAGEDSATIGVLPLVATRTVRTVGSNIFPRRWPLGQSYNRTKTSQTLQNGRTPNGSALSDDDQDRLGWLLALSDAGAWQQLPPSEVPRSAWVNKNEGCPQHGTAIFAHGGFYPWRHNHQPLDFLCQCPVGEETYPSNDILNDDFLSGPYPDDGFGYVDDSGACYLFAAHYHWMQAGTFTGHIALLTRALRATNILADTREAVVHRLALLLGRLVVEELYLAAVPQFRYGSHLTTVADDLWGPTDTAIMEPFPDRHPFASGTICYSIAMPGLIQTCCRAYDALFPYLHSDSTLPGMLNAMGLPVHTSDDVLQLIEEMLACFIQHHLDNYTSCNHPHSSVATLICLRTLCPDNITELMDFLFDGCDDQIRTFVTNGFYPDGLCYEASGGYNSGHILGAHLLHEHVEALRKIRPDEVSAERYPPMALDPRFKLVAKPPIETIMCGKAVAAYGDDRAPGSMAEGSDPSAVLTEDVPCWLGWGQAEHIYTKALEHDPCPLYARVLNALGKIQENHTAKRLINDHGAAGEYPSLMLDHGGIGILRLRREDGTDHAAVFSHYISQPFHRHDDFLDVSLVAFDRLWSPDLGYPALHETCHYWEGYWATHNRGKIIAGATEDVVGSGKCNLFADTELACLMDLEGAEGEFHDWRLWTPQDRFHRRLLVLIPSVGEGTVLVDMYRLEGGDEHWRSYLGTQGSMEWEGSDLTARAGTAAGETVARGQIEKAPSGKRALAMMDQVREGSADTPWKAVNVCRDDPDWAMDIHGVACSPGTRVMICRGGHPLTRPEDSPYEFSPILLNRKADNNAWSSFDLVFEPHHQSPTIEHVSSLRALNEEQGASGVSIQLIDGSKVTVLWNPFAKGPVCFEGGSELDGPVAVLRDTPGTDQRCLVTLGGSVKRSSSSFSCSRAPMSGKVVALGDDPCKAVVRPDPGCTFEKGMRVRLFPRGHWQEIEAVEAMGDGTQELTFSLTRVLSTARVEPALPVFEDNEIVLHSRLPLAWAGYFRKCTAASRSGGWQVPILDVRMREDTPRCYAIIDEGADQAMLDKIMPGEWIDFLDYVPGDTVVEVEAELTLPASIVATPPSYHQ